MLRHITLIAAGAIALATVPATAHAAPAKRAPAARCTQTPKQIVTAFMDLFYVQKKVRQAFETYVVEGYIQHNPFAATGRAPAIAFLEPAFADPAITYSIKRIIADGDLVAVHAHGVMKAGDPGAAVVDILRVKDCKIVEHWDVIQPVPAQSANTNTMF
ncbi:polyketide cyclase [Novosphingobium sp. FSY-8]|uniref:Polyketide cyclase n=1 Tax=Novosphingobium ovatum TaxID=1908523 RepID=A0ABW9XDG2_9SPHN|nr:nuclear transport factor 2 family protein [Novosphingobium ovatum]NBC36574.1 polyketide cyclase [Novosphingobium ovatum]